MPNKIIIPQLPSHTTILDILQPVCEYFAYFRESVLERPLFMEMEKISYDIDSIFISALVIVNGSRVYFERTCHEYVLN